MIGLIVSLIILGVVLWAVESLIPMDPMIKRIIQVVVVLCVLFYIVRFFGFV
jgi:uncharacterized membrane protein YwzB